MRILLNILYYTKYIILILVIFFYIFPVAFIGLPFSTHVLIGIGGFIFWFIKCITKKNVKLSTDTFSIVLYSIAISIAASISLFINSNNENKFVFYFFPLSVNFFAAYFIYQLFYKFKIILNENVMCRFLLIVVLLQSSITLIMNLNPNIIEYIINIQKEETISPETVEETILFRFIGLGSMFFYAGIINSIALIVISYLIAIKYTKSYILVFSHLFIFCIGMIMSRTTIIGFILSLCLLLLYNLIYDKASIVTVIMSLLIKYFIIVCIITPIIIYKLDYSTIENYFLFGFEMFSNYFSGDGLTTQSTEQMKDLYIFPTTIKTYLLGDSRWTDSLNPSLYYMNTDIGYLRLIFYFGILGLLIFFAYILNLIHLLTKGNSRINLLYYTLLATFIFFNFKGFADISNILFLFYFSKKNIINEKIQISENNRILGIQ